MTKVVKRRCCRRVHWVMGLAIAFFLVNIYTWICFMSAEVNSETVGSKNINFPLIISDDRGDSHKLGLRRVMNITGKLSNGTGIKITVSRLTVTTTALQGFTTAQLVEQRQSETNISFSPNNHSHMDRGRRVLMKYLNLNNKQNLPVANFHQTLPRKSLLHHWSKESTQAHRKEHSLITPSALNMTIMELREWVKRANEKEEIHNQNIFDSSSIFSNLELVIIVQVHNRIEYLQYFIQSLKDSQGINQTLVIFSHSFLSDEINKLIQDIDFCLVVQVFFPYSLQLHKGGFPDDDNRKCDGDCNAFNEDNIFNRSATQCAVKHHWFWKVNHVFDHMKVTSKYNGLVLFLEEDFYMMPDFISVLKQMYHMKNEYCANCSFFALQSHENVQIFDARAASLVTVKKKLMTKGFAFDKSTWKELKLCAQEFCKINDYNWDWSLRRTSTFCMRSPPQTLIVMGTRLFEFGRCGMHGIRKNCDPSPYIGGYQFQIQTKKKKLFPSKLKIIIPKPRPPTPLPPLYKGWADTRDHHLCMRFLDNDTHSA